MILLEHSEGKNKTYRSLLTVFHVIFIVHAFVFLFTTGLIRDDGRIELLFIFIVLRVDIQNVFFLTH